MRNAVAALVAVIVAGCTSIPSSEIVRAEADGVPILFEYLRAERGPVAGSFCSTEKFVVVSDKPIKYVETWTTPVNTVGDPTRSVCSDCGQGVPHFSGVTGPFVKGKVYSSRSKGHWFDQIGCIRLDRCRIEFMDGSVQEFAGESLRRLEASTFEACPPGR